MSSRDSGTKYEYGDNISDALRSRAGTDFADFDEERLNRMYTSNLMVGSGKDKEHERRMEDIRYRDMLSTKRNPAYDKVKREQAEDLFYGKSRDDFYQSLTDWADAADAAGIKKVDSATDVAEIRKKTADEYLKRMIGAGVDGYAKTEDLDKLKEESKAEPIEYNKSEKLKEAEDNVSEFNDTELNNQGSSAFGKQVQSGMSELGIGEFNFNPKAQGYADNVKNAAKDVMSEAGVVTRGPNMGAVSNGTGYTTEGDQTFDYDDNRKDLGNDYTDDYKLRISKNLKPVNRDGSPRSSKAYNVKKKLLNANAFNGGY